MNGSHFVAGLPNQRCESEPRVARLRAANPAGCARSRVAANGSMCHRFAQHRTSSRCAGGSELRGLWLLVQTVLSDPADGRPRRARHASSLPFDSREQRLPFGKIGGVCPDAAREWDTDIPHGNANSRERATIANGMSAPGGGAPLKSGVVTWVSNGKHRPGHVPVRSVPGILVCSPGDSCPVVCWIPAHHLHAGSRSAFTASRRTSAGRRYKGSDKGSAGAALWPILRESFRDLPRLRGLPHLLHRREEVGVRLRLAHLVEQQLHGLDR